MLCAALLAWFFLAPAESGHARGVALFNEHKYAEAIPVLQAAIAAEQPGSDDYRESAMVIGQSYFMLSELPQAIPWLEKTTATNESSYMLGYAYQQTGQMDQAVAAFARLFGVEPRSAAAHLLTGQMLMKRQLEEAGAEEIRKALQMNPALPEAHYLLGEIAVFHGKVQEGIVELEQELHTNPNFSMAWFRMGDALAREEQWEAAITNLQRAVWLNKNYSGSYILLGKCYLKKHDLPKAERFLRQALDLDPKNYAATYLLGETLVASGRTDEGRELLRKSGSLRQEPSGN